MQPLSLQQTLEAINSLNKAEQPFTYRTEGQQIIGEWKILDAMWAAPLAAGKVDKNYKVIVSLNETKRTYGFKEYYTESKSGIRMSDDGNLSFGSEKSFGSGKMIGRSFEAGVGVPNQSQNQTAIGGPTYQASFNTAQIKQPLFAFLEQVGWKIKGGWFNKLFSH
jgi:hypothetical protein